MKKLILKFIAFMMLSFGLFFGFGFCSTFSSNLFFESVDNYNNKFRQSVGLADGSQGIGILLSPQFVSSYIPLSASIPISSYYNTSSSGGLLNRAGSASCYYNQTRYFMYNSSSRSFGFGFAYIPNYPDMTLYHSSLFQDFVAGSGFSSTYISKLDPCLFTQENQNEQVRIFSEFGLDWETGLPFFSSGQSLDSYVRYKSNYISYATKTSSIYTPFVNPNKEFRSHFFGWGNASSWVMTTDSMGDYNIKYSDFLVGGIENHIFGTSFSSETQYDNSLFIALDGGYNATYGNQNQNTLVLTPLDGAEMQYVKASVYGCKISSIDSITGSAFDDQCPLLQNGYLSYSNDSTETKIFPWTGTTIDYDLSATKYGFWFSPGATFVDVSLTTNHIYWETNATYRYGDFYIVQLTGGQLVGNLSNDTTALQTAGTVVDVTEWTGGYTTPQPGDWDYIGNITGVNYTGDITSSIGFIAKMWTCYGSGVVFSGLSFNLSDYIGILDGTFLDFNLIAPLSCIPTAFFDGATQNMFSLTGYNISGSGRYTSSTSTNDKNNFGGILTLLFLAVPLIIFYKLILK